MGFDWDGPSEGWFVMAIRILFQKHFLVLDGKIFFWPKIVKQIILTK